jgi:hypothetical protein
VSQVWDWVKGLTSAPIALFCVAYLSPTSYYVSVPHIHLLSLKYTVRLFTYWCVSVHRF